MRHRSTSPTSWPIARSGSPGQVDDEGCAALGRLLDANRATESRDQAVHDRETEAVPARALAGIPVMQHPGLEGDSRVVGREARPRVADRHPGPVGQGRDRDHDDRSLGTHAHGVVDE